MRDPGSKLTGNCLKNKQDEKNRKWKKEFREMIQLIQEHQKNDSQTLKNVQRVLKNIATLIKDMPTYREQEDKNKLMADATAMISKQDDELQELRDQLKERESKGLALMKELDGKKQKNAIKSFSNSHNALLSWD